VSDQYGNTVDKEVWAPLKANDWISRPAIGFDMVPTPVPLTTHKEWALALADGKVDEQRYTDEGTARQDLQCIRYDLKGYAIPEEYWPVLMERTVETVATSWKILNV
jgi:hypothetical protein